MLEQRLASHQWLALDHVAIADRACFPYVALASEGEIPLDPYAACAAESSGLQIDDELELGWLLDGQACDRTRCANPFVRL